MNWETAKHWLIAAFLALDILLVWQLHQIHREITNYVEPYTDQLANTKTLLAERGFALDTDVPQAHADMSTIQAKFVLPSLKLVAMSAFPRTVASAHVGSDGAVTPSGKITLLGPGTWQVVYKNPIPMDTNQGTPWLRFIWKSRNYVLDGASTGPSATTYLQQCDDYPIFDASVVMQTQSSTMDSYTQTMLGSITVIGNAKPTISALDSLNSLAMAVDNEPTRTDNRIVGIELGYMRKVSFNPWDTGLASSNYWFPVWRIVTSTQVYYINAFTGEVDVPS